jgi:hypothetical protein
VRKRLTSFGQCGFHTQSFSSKRVIQHGTASTHSLVSRYCEPILAPHMNRDRRAVRVTPYTCFTVTAEHGRQATTLS